MIKVYAAYGLPSFAKGVVRDLRVLWALEELALPYDVHWMHAMKGEHKIDPNRLLNPFGKIPSLEDGAQRMFESAAIVLYLYENAGKAPQDAHARAEVNQWCFAAVNTVEPPMLELFRWDFFWKEKPGRDGVRSEFLAHAHERLADLGKALGDKAYLVAGNFGPADILMTTALDFAQHLPELFDAHPVVKGYRERCHARPGYRRALAKQGQGPQANAA